MDNHQIRDALASAFLDAELTVRVVNARSTESIYLTASDGNMPYTVRIANHKNSRKFSTVDDYWIDTTRADVTPYINGALRGAAKRFGRSVREYVPPVVQEPVKSPEISSEVRTRYSDKPENNLIALAQFYVEHEFTPFVFTWARQEMVDYEATRDDGPEEVEVPVNDQKGVIQRFLETDEAFLWILLSGLALIGCLITLLR
jgi:hypothetical protein